MHPFCLFSVLETVYEPEGDTYCNRAARKSFSFERGELGQHGRLVTNPPTIKALRFPCVEQSGSVTPGTLEVAGLCSAQSVPRLPVTALCCCGEVGERLCWQSAIAGWVLPPWMVQRPWEEQAVPPPAVPQAAIVLLAGLIFVFFFFFPNAPPCYKWQSSRCPVSWTLQPSHAASARLEAQPWTEALPHPPQC